MTPWKVQMRTPDADEQALSEDEQRVAAREGVVGVDAHCSHPCARTHFARGAAFEAAVDHWVQGVDACQ